MCPSDSVPGTLLQVTGGLVALTGVLSALVAVQFLMWWTVPPLETYGLYGMLTGGLATIGLGWGVADGRFLTVVVSMLAVPTLGFFMAGWALWCAAHLSFTLFMLFAPLAAFWATACLPFCFQAARRCAQGRALVAAQGVF